MTRPSNQTLHATTPMLAQALLLSVAVLFAQPVGAAETLAKTPVEKSESDVDETSKEWNVRRQQRSVGNVTRVYPPAETSTALAPRRPTNAPLGAALPGGQHANRNGIGGPLRT